MSVGIGVGVSVGVAVGAVVGVGVGVSVGVGVGVSVGVTIGVSVGVAVGVSVGVTVGVLQLHEIEVVLPPSVVKVKVPLEQSLAGIVIATGLCTPGDTEPELGLKLTSEKLLVADQFTLPDALASRERVALHVQLPSLFEVQLVASKLVGDTTSVGVPVGVAVGVSVGVTVDVAVGVSVGVAVGVSVGVGVGVGISQDHDEG